MSLVHALFNDYLRTLDDDPFLFQPSYGGLSHNRRRHHHHHHPRSQIDPFFSTLVWNNQPSLHLSEEENGTYVVEAQVPGVKKENLEVKVGDGGRSLTVSGNMVRRAEAAQPPAAAEQQTATAATTSTASASTSQEVTETDDSAKQVQTSQSGNWSGHASMFTRTVWLPNPIDSSSIKARLEDGILTIRASRANMDSFNVTID